MKTRVKIVLGLFIITALGFTVFKTLQEDQLIVGAWISTEEPNWKLVFHQDGKCYDYYKEELDTTYNWEITNDETPSGFKISYLTLVNTQDAEDVYEYQIHGIGEEGMHLEYNTGIGLSQLFFEKQR